MFKGHNISLRERKYAQTKIGLVNAAVELMKEKRFKDIALKELCETIPISEMTFYHYFPKKTDLLIYVLQLWSLEMAWKRKQWEHEKSGLEMIKAIFETGAQRVEDHPFLFKEAVRILSQKSEKPAFNELSLAEKLCAFPDLPDIENVQVPRSLEFADMLKPYVEQAVQEGELPESTDITIVVSLLQALHLGSLLGRYWEGKASWRTLCKQQLQLIWDGVWAQDAQRRAAEATETHSE